jgi:hypothetical protein
VAGDKKGVGKGFFFLYFFLFGIGMKRLTGFFAGVFPFVFFLFLRGRYGWIWMDGRTIGAGGGGLVWWRNMRKNWKITGGVAEVELGEEFQAGEWPSFLALAVHHNQIQPFSQRLSSLFGFTSSKKGWICQKTQ